MKTYIIWGLIAFVAVGAIGMQVGVFRAEKNWVTAIEDSPRPKPPVETFPDDLIPAARAKPVPNAMEYKPGPDPHRIFVMYTTGQVHPWQESMSGDWQAESVSETELVVVVGNQRKTYLGITTYASGAPPITRYQFELEISVIAAKTGQIMANRTFRNVPRPVDQIESWETTLIGRPVAVQQVLSWVYRMSKAGFPEDPRNSLITTQID